MPAPKMTQDGITFSGRVRWVAIGSIFIAAGGWFWQWKQAKDAADQQVLVWRAEGVPDRAALHEEIKTARADVKEELSKLDTKVTDLGRESNRRFESLMNRIDELFLGKKIAENPN